MLVTEKSNFIRGDKASASVRLRSKKTTEANGGGGAKKKNRHSGDFSFFKGGGHALKKDQKDEGDWAFITFQNGVPTVQDIQTNVGVVNSKEVAAGVPPPQTATPPSNMRQQAPPPQQRMRQSVAPSTNVNKRVSGDFSMFAPPNMQQHATPAALALRQQQPQPQVRQMGRGRMGSPSKRAVTPSNVTQVMLGSNNAATPISRSTPQPQPQQQQFAPRPNVMYRRRSEQLNGGVARNVSNGPVAKRCSGDFEYVKNMNRRSGSDYSLLMADTPILSEEVTEATPPSVVRVQVNYNNNNSGGRPKSMAIPSPDVVRGTPYNRSNAATPINVSEPRPLGLGRRAVTQINIQHNKKNSYNSAMCKSQENLVKVGGDTAFFKATPPLVYICHTQ